MLLNFKRGWISSDNKGNNVLYYLYIGIHSIVMSPCRPDSNGYLILRIRIEGTIEPMAVRGQDGGVHF